MARPVRDSIVLERAKAMKFDSIYLNNLSLYAGDAVSTIEKIKLNETTFGIAEISVVKRLSDKYESLVVRDGETSLMVEKSPGEFINIPATKDQIRMMKALVVEQVNVNADYSSVVAMLFYQLARQVYTKKDIGVFPENENLTPMQQVVYKEYGEYIRKKLVESGTIVKA